MTQRWHHADFQLQLPPDRPLRVVVVADTHSKPHRQAARVIAAQKPDHILHAGDIGDVSVIEGLTELAPTTTVRGNIDPVGFPDSVDIGIESGGVRRLGLLLTHIAVYGPKLRADAARRAKQHGANLVICGHSHVPFIGRDKGLAIFNPGSIGPRRFQLPITLGVMTISHERVDLRHVSCETGERWEP